MHTLSPTLKTANMCLKLKDLGLNTNYSIVSYKAIFHSFNKFLVHLLCNKSFAKRTRPFLQEYSLLGQTVMQTTVKWCDTSKPRVLWEYTGVGRCYRSLLQRVNV